MLEERASEREREKERANERERFYSKRKKRRKKKRKGKEKKNTLSRIPNIDTIRRHCYYYQTIFTVCHVEHVW